MKISKQTILLTGGTGSFGGAFIKHLFAQKSFKGVIRVFSRDEFKQHGLLQKYGEDRRLRFFIGDVRDLARLKRAARGADMIVHAAALKHVPILEYNPFEAVKTNIFGSENVIECAIDLGIRRVLFVSSDKAVSPVNLYGATKMVAEKVFVQANSYVGSRKTMFSVARYGNVMGSRGSVVSTFLDQKKNNLLTITDERMTRFWITLDQGIKFVIKCLQIMRGGEIFVPKIPSIKILDLAKTIAPKAKIKKIGMRPGEKLHEVLINEDEVRHTREFRDFFVIEPEFHWWADTFKIGGKKLREGFRYSSDNNKKWLGVRQIQKMLTDLGDENT